MKREIQGLILPSAGKTGGDGIPDFADPYPNDPNNNTAWWPGGTFLINDQWPTLPAQYHRANAGDADGDGIPDDLDPYPNDPWNNTYFTWPSQPTSFVINDETTWFYPTTYGGFYADRDGDGIPDVADPYPDDPNNHNRTAGDGGCSCGHGGCLGRSCPGVNDPAHCTCQNPGATDNSGPDSDGDGMSDSYEIANGLNPNLAADAADAPMGDSVFNVEKAQHALATAMLVSDPALYLQITGHDQSWLNSQLNDPTKSIAENDWDGDGISNIDELLVFHTDPRDPTSQPTVDQIRQALGEGKCSLTTRANFFWLLGCTCGQNGCPGTTCSGAQDPTHCACQSGSGSGSGGGPGRGGGGSPPTGCACSQPGCDCNTNGSGQVCGGNTLCHQCSCQFVGAGCTCTNDTTCSGHCVPCPCPGVGAGCQCPDKNGCDGTGNMCFQRPCACPAVGSGCMCASVFGCDGNGSCQVGDPTADFTQVSPNSGFDGVSSPHWLMVPQAGQNRALSLTKGTDSHGVTFTPQPEGADLSVDPRSASSSPTTITIGSSTLGWNSGVWTDYQGNHIGDPLWISVKKLQVKTISIHSVTQHRADSSDIPSNDAPDPFILQLYLNIVFGPQTNTYFVVVREDFSVDYDNWHVNKILDVYDKGAPTPEEDTIMAQANSSVAFNIYYVHDLLVTKRAGGIDVGNAATKFEFGTTYVPDGSGDVLLVTAHEVGHLLGLGHADERTMVDGITKNTAFIENSDPTIRLMYSKLQKDKNPKPLLLIKPEWDIINPDENPE